MTRLNPQQQRLALAFISAYILFGATLKLAGASDGVLLFVSGIGLALAAGLVVDMYRDEGE